MAMNAWRHQLLYRTRAECPHRVDLIRDLHGAQFRADTRSDACSDHQRGKHRAEFAQQRNSHDATDVDFRAETREELPHLKSQHHPGKNRRQGHDIQRLESNRVELFCQCPKLEGAAEQ